jgi:hypothetical protein
VRQADNRRHESDSLHPGSHIDDERTVDLQGVHGQFREVTERGESGPEIVDGDADAHGADPVQDGNIVLGVVHDHAFGDFQLQAGRRTDINSDRLLIRDFDLVVFCRMGHAGRGEINERVRRVLRVACDIKPELERDPAVHGCALERILRVLSGAGALARAAE